MVHRRYGCCAADNCILHVIHIGVVLPIPAFTTAVPAYQCSECILKHVNNVANRIKVLGLAMIHYIGRGGSLDLPC